MGSLWQFFGLPDPEGGTANERAPPAQASQGPVSLSGGDAKPAQEPTPTEPVVDTSVLSPVDVRPLRTPPLGWNGPITPDGEAFHDLGTVSYTHLTLPTKVEV